MVLNALICSHNLLTLKFFYDIFIRIYPLLAKLTGIKNEKARLWVEGRKDILSKLEKAFANNTSKVVWVHCSSLGEFEQGKPLIEDVKRQTPNFKLILTFFSPSGYEVRKNYEGADWVFYLPMDSSQNAKRFFDIVQPSLVLFVKYEYWFYYLSEAKQRNIPLLLVSGIFRQNQPFFTWYGGFHKQMLQCFTHFFVQNQSSANLLKSIGFDKNVTISGDTRFDRVTEIAEQFSPIQVIEDFIGSSKVIVAGSTWLEDDKELAHYTKNHPEIKFIIAPHDIQQSRIDECVGLYKNVVLYSSIVNRQSTIVKQEPKNNDGQWAMEDEHHSSIVNRQSSIARPQQQNNDRQWTMDDGHSPNVLLINNIGLLSKLYHYATICYVGGGFGGDGVHNVLEAAVYNKPVVTGSEYEKYFEAAELVEAGGAFPVESALELEKIFDKLLNDENAYYTASLSAGNYVKSKTGATQSIINYIQEKRLLTN